MFTRFHIVTIIMMLELILLAWDMPSDNDFVIPLPLSVTVQETLLSNNTNTTLTEKDYLAYGKKESIAKSIAKEYKYISSTEALKVVNTVYKEAPKHGFKPELILGVIATESSFNSKANSSAGAKGYMQVIPYWHQDKIKGRNIYDTQVNIEVGVAFLAECFKKTNTHRQALACYNGAVTPSKVDDYNISVSFNTRQMSKLLVSL